MNSHEPGYKEPSYPDLYDLVMVTRIEQQLGHRGSHRDLKVVRIV